MSDIKLRYTAIDLLSALRKEEPKKVKKIERLRKAHQLALRKWALKVRRIATTSIRAFLTDVANAPDPALLLAKTSTGCGLRGFGSTCDFKRKFPIPDVPSKHGLQFEEKYLANIRARLKACSASPQTVYHLTPTAYADFIEGRPLR